MANGNTIAEIRSLLAEKSKISQGVVNRLTLSLMAEMYQKQLDAAEDERKNREETKVRLDLLEKRSWGLWIWNHPKAATVIMLSLYSFAISDIRDPVMGWLGTVLQALIKL